MRLALFGAIVVAAMAGEALAVAQPAAPVVWARVPTPMAIAEAFPATAAGQAHGIVSLRCRVASEGGLTACAVISETPAGYGFGDAALDLTKTFKVMIAPGAGGASHGAPASFAIAFDSPAAPPPPVRIADPLWVQSPDPSMMQNAFPTAAAKQGVKTGVGEVHCTLKHDGGLTKCSVAREDPPGLGFGAAALALAQSMALNPWTADGRPVDGAEITLPIRLNAAGGETAEPPARGYSIASFDRRWACAGTSGPYTPERALRSGVRAGVAVIDCAVNADGSLYACTLVADAPPDFGFGAAALVMARRRVLTTTPIIEDGKPVSGRVVRLTIQSKLGACAP